MVYCFFADGFEETEAIAPVDMLKRADVEVVTVGVGGEYIRGAHDISIKCDITVDAVTLDDNLDGIILPGGMPGTLNLDADENVQKCIDFCADNGKLISAICAAPMIIGKKNLLDGKEAICYPGFEEHLHGAVVSSKSVVIDGNFVTAKGAGVAVDFGLELVAYLKDRETADKIKAAIQCVL